MRQPLRYLCQRHREQRRQQQEQEGFAFEEEEEEEEEYSAFDVQKERKLFRTVAKQVKAGRKKRSVKEAVLKKKVKLSSTDQDELLENMLVRQRPQALSRLEKKVLKMVCKKELPDRFRRSLWLRASGALALMSLPENKHYYRNLKNLPLSYPNPSFGQIELDLRRTFTELKIAKSEKLVSKLRNVLTTYTKRNPTIGYCQGMNFLVGRLLKVIQHYSEGQEASTASSSHTKKETPLVKRSIASTAAQARDEEKDEEEAFWIFVAMVESILPIDYYSSMVGALIDQQIFYGLFQEALPDLCQHFQQVGFDPSLLAFQWLVCFLSYNLRQDVSDRVWDFFFLKGPKVIFRVSLALLHLMKKDLMRSRDFAEIFETLESNPRKMIDVNILFQTAEMPKYKVKESYIREKRQEIRGSVEERL